jgi:hypothetical protein
VSLDPSSLGKILKKLGYARLSARPKHHAQNAAALEAFKANFPPRMQEIRDHLPTGTPLEIWFDDEARIGQKNKITRRWARRGTRPSAPKD